MKIKKNAVVNEAPVKRGRGRPKKIVEAVEPVKKTPGRPKKIVEAAKNDEYVNKIIIFGSSIRYDCDITSDLDICIDWKEDCYDNNGVLKAFTHNMRKIVSDVTDGNSDVVNYEYLEGTLIKDAVMEGVVVYEYNV